MSLGGSTNYAQEHAGPYNDEITALAQLGVIVVSASGNHGNSNAVSYPSAEKFSLSIGSVHHGASHGTPDKISSFSNRHPDLTTVFAPGHSIPAAWINEQTKIISGTSMASPVIAGTVVLIQEAALDILGRKLSFNEVSFLLKDKGTKIFDGGQEYLRVNVEKMVKEIVNIQKPGFHKVDLKAGDVLEKNFGFADINDQKNGSVDNNAGLTLVGTSASDVLNGSSSADHILGGGGNDFIQGNGGADNLNLGDGNDIALVEGSNSTITLGLGRDELIFTPNAKEVKITDFQVPGKGISTVYKLEGKDTGEVLVGKVNALDVIFAGSGNDTVYGFDQADILIGEGGNDDVFGGSGDDFIIAGSGKDNLTGGEGKDSFIFDLSKSGFYDFHSINDFDENDDRIFLLSSKFDSKPTIEVLGSNTLLYYKGKKFAEIKDFVSSSFSKEDLALVTESSFDYIEDNLHFDIV